MPHRILSIAALCLGAQHVTGVDNDLQALTASTDNAALNGVADRLALFDTLDRVEPAFDIVVANILASTLLEMAEEISKRTVHGGRLALSGILSRQIEDVTNAYVNWFTFDPPVDRNDWVRLTATRR